jgi:hypothetical protein
VSNVDMWMVVRNSEDLRGGSATYGIYDWEPDAIAAAKRGAEATRAPHDIYKVELIGSASVPQATFHDRRPQAMPMSSAGDQQAKTTVKHD